MKKMVETIVRCLSVVCQLGSSDTVEAANARLHLSARSIKQLLKRLLPFGLPTGKFPTCLLAQEDYLMGYSDEYNMPLWTAFSVKPVNTLSWCCKININFLLFTVSVLLFNVCRLNIYKPFAFFHCIFFVSSNVKRMSVKVS